jgi:hypothetical protein
MPTGTHPAETQVIFLEGKMSKDFAPSVEAPIGAKIAAKILVSTN